eukprot:TRINITY_DN25966_c0_g1_i1.p1 TRINITY_DN25966_c0_g1~~TRINITY_DN25966_c0_g1_i1.p1  ORF type:complete len:496 (+),score=107.14 TRINITY_DN25966_c0_g1_i1:47-1489(+)
MGVLAVAFALASSDGAAVAQRSASLLSPPLKSALHAAVAELNDDVSGVAGFGGSARDDVQQKTILGAHVASTLRPSVAWLVSTVAVASMAFSATVARAAAPQASARSSRGRPTWRWHRRLRSLCRHAVGRHARGMTDTATVERAKLAGFDLEAPNPRLVKVTEPLRTVEESASLPVKETNHGFLYLKPHANLPAVQRLVEARLKQEGIEIVEQGELLSEDIVRRRVADKHYSGVAAKAVEAQPADLVVQPAAKAAFEAVNGLSWEEALSQDLVVNAATALERLGITHEELDAEWSELQLGEGKLKFAGGFYVGRIRDLFVINGFYMAVRAIYTVPGTSVHWYSLRWDPDDLRWSDFRKKVLGSTDPAVAEATSLRGEVTQRWKEMGLPAEPHLGENVAHASASPFEAFSERVNWLDADPKKDAFGEQLLRQGISLEKLRLLTRDPKVVYEGDEWSTFDLLENLDSSECSARVSRIELPDN